MPQREIPPRRRLIAILLLLSNSYHAIEASERLQPRSPMPSITPPHGSPNNGASGGGMNSARNGMNSAKYGIGMNDFTYNYQDSYLDTSNVPPTEQDEFLHSQPPKTSTPHSVGYTPFDLNPSQILDKFRLNKGISVVDAMKALGVINPEEDHGAISLFPFDQSPIPYTGNQGAEGLSVKSPDKNTDSVSSPFIIEMYRNPGLGPIDWTKSPPIDEDDGENIDADENLEFNIPVFNTQHQNPNVLSDTTSEGLYPGRTDIRRTTLAMYDRVTPIILKDPSINMIPQDESDPEYANGFILTPGGITSAAVKVNAIKNESGKLILAVQYGYLYPLPSRWTISNDGILRLAGTNYFVYVCHTSGEKSGFQIGDWDDFGKLSKSCTGRSYGNFYYTGWRWTKSRPRPGLPDDVEEIQFSNPKLTSLNKDGLFTTIYPTRALDSLWDIRRHDDGTESMRMPKYIQIATLPNWKVKAALSAGPNEDQAVSLYIGDVKETGNPPAKGWALKDIYAGAPIQIQCLYQPLRFWNNL
ncbi:hypothetical protein ABW20_dc0108636 [Dactylellina cionopaga]|nr:hypothetical protein ABW20_dc0108636 [Dactylellina cionopaga]